MSEAFLKSKRGFVDPFEVGAEDVSLGALLVISSISATRESTSPGETSQEVLDGDSSDDGAETYAGSPCHGEKRGRRL